MASDFDVSKEHLRQYTVEDLLHLRDSLPYVTFNIDKLSEDGKSMPVVEIPRPLYVNSRLKSMPTKELFNIRAETLKSDANSEDEDSILFKEHDSRRARTSDSWQYRRRENSDRSTQPLSAPSGFAAQKSDNFQKFFRAVASPTHIRVTAGGRIVPNVQAPPQPMFTWNKEKMYFEPFKPSQGWMYEISGDVAGNTDHPPSTPVSVSMTTPNFEDTVPSEMSNVSLLSKTPPAIPVVDVKISPPQQFDASLPFFFNNQIMYPMQTGFPQGLTAGYPQLGMMHPRILGGSSIHAELLHHPAPMPYPGFNHHVMMPMMSSSLPGVMPGMYTGVVPNLFPMPMGMSTQLPPTSHLFTQPAPPTVASPATFPAITTTKRNIVANLRQQLRTIEHQLTHNVHQIDVLTTQQRKESIMAQIKMFEDELGSLTRLQKPHPDPMPMTDAPGLQKANTSESQTQISQSPVTEENPNPQTPPNLGDRRDENSLQLNSLFNVENGKKSKLTIDSAKAPPFKPRSNSQVESPIPPHAQTKSEVDPVMEELSNPHESIADCEARLLSKATTWNVQGQSGYGGVSHFHTPSILSCSGTNNYSGSAIEDDSQGLTTYGVRSSLHLTANNIPAASIPYLVGCLPPGTTSTSATSKDYIYHRDLTDAERRSRQLYWGNTPREKGLPKFDGKDFYPASPVKESAVPVPKRGEEYSGRSGEISQAESTTTDTWQSIFTKNDLSTFATNTEVLSESTVGKQSLISRRNDDDDNDDTSSLDSWGLPMNPTSVESGASSSTVQKTTRFKIHDTKISNLKEKAQAQPEERQTMEKVIDVSSTKPALVLKLPKNSPVKSSFLQDMLKNNQSTTSMPTPLFSVSLSTTNATGYLPQYTGTAAASLAPVFNNSNGMIAGSSRGESKSELSSGPKDQLQSYSASRAHRTENVPMSTSNSLRADGLGAAEYLRKISYQSKALQPAQGLEKDSGVGPVMDGDW